MQVDPVLYSADLLEAIRPWMTLDSDPADHQRVNDRLEAWSLFSSNEYEFVVRLVSAGTYDRRAAYFAHGRAWKTDDLPKAFDPGLYLGLSGAFDTPWQEQRQEMPFPEGTPAVVRPEQIGDEQPTAARLLGHLFQALDNRYPLIVAAPIRDFATGSGLHALTSLARAGLPAPLRRACRVRVYSRFPELFLRHLGAHLVVIPEEVASAALAARPNATLLDRQGEKLAGKELDPRAYDYAAAVVERAIAIPEGLTLYSERIGALGVADSRSIQITYNLAFAFAGPDERRGELLRRYLPRAADKLGPGIDWKRLIPTDEWKRFPPDALLDQLLTDGTDLSDGRRKLLDAVTDAAAHLGMQVDPRLAEWWEPRQPGKLQRLLRLLAHDPPLVSPNAVAARTSDISIPELRQTEHLHTALAAEAKTGRLERRVHDSAELAGAAVDSKVLAILTGAVSGKGFDPAWADIYARTADRDDLIAVAERWLGDPAFFGPAWGKVPRTLLDRLRGLDPPPNALASLAIAAASRLKPADHLEIYLRAADLLTRIGPTPGEDVVADVMDRLWKALPLLTDAQCQYLEGIAFEKEWRCLELKNLELSTLLDLASRFERETSLDHVYAQLDARMARDPEATTDALIGRDWWYFWRSRSKLTSKNGPDVLRRSALAWFCSDAWNRHAGIEPTLEAWEKVLKDLPQGLPGELLASLRRLGRRWAWITPFEEQQMDALIERANDLGALAELSEAAPPEWEPSDGSLVNEYVLGFLPSFSKHLPASGLRWLLEDRSGQRPDLLDLEQSAFLHKHAGHRTQHALEARRHSVTAHLDVDARAAVEAAGSPSLWGIERFVTRVEDWVIEKGSVAAIDRSVAKAINDRIPDQPAKGLKKPASATLITDLDANGLKRLARALDASLQDRIQKEKVADKAIDALARGRVNDPVWPQLATMLTSESSIMGTNALTVLAERIYNRKQSSPDQTNSLAIDGWKTFRGAAKNHPQLLNGIERPPRRDIPARPLLELAASMLGPGAIGMAALQLVYAAHPTWRQETPCWRHLMRAMRDYRRPGGVRSADDRPTVALALIFGYLETPKEYEAFHLAVEYERPEWDLLREFGEVYE